LLPSGSKSRTLSLCVTAPTNRTHGGNVTRRHLLLLLAALPAVPGLPGCAGMPGRLEPPSVTVSDLRIGTASVFEQQYFVTLRIQNPNDMDLQIKGLSFELDLNDQPFAKGVSGEAVTVARYSSQTVEVETISGLSGLLRQFGVLTRDGPREAFRYRLKGRLSLAGAVAPLAFDERGEVALGGLGGAGRE
jgi:LEA14-like dessication related protein